MQAPPPNNKLKRAREMHGWSQKYVADAVGAPNYRMVSRWEHGTLPPFLSTGRNYVNSLIAMLSNWVF